MKNTKIMIFARSYPYWGGVERWLSDLSRIIEGAEFDLLMVLLEGHKYNNPDFFAKCQNIKSFSRITVKSGSSTTKRALIKKALYQYQPDIVIPVLTWDALSVAAEFKDELDFSLIVPTHEYSEASAKELESIREKVDYIVTVDKLTNAYLTDYIQHPRPQLKTISAAYPIERIASVQQPKLDQQLHIGFCGRLNADEKQAVTFIEVLKQMEGDRKFRFHWLGEDSHCVKEDQTLNRIVTSGQLRFHGSLYGTQVQSFFDAVNCILICSKWETGPIFAWEAMAAKKLLISSRYLGQAAEGFLKHNENCLLFDVGNANECFEQLSLAKQHPNVMQKIIDNAKQCVDSERSPQEMKINWLKLLREASFENTTKIKSSINRELPLIAILKQYLGELNETLAELHRSIFKRKFRPRSARSEWPPHACQSQSKEFLDSLYKKDISIGAQDNK